MSFTYERKHPERTPGSASSEAQVREDPRDELKEQVIKATGMWRGRAHKEDPMSSIDEVFQDEYSAADLLGDRKLLGMKRAGPGLVGTRGRPVEEDEIYSIGKDTDKDSLDKQRRSKSVANEVMERSDMSQSFVPENEGTQLRKFEEIGLRRGKLSASVLKGTSEMMLFSCLKRTYRIGDGEPEHEHKIFESRERPERCGESNFDNARDYGTSLTYNKSYPRSAMALTLQRNRTALDTVKQLGDVVDRGEAGSFTLWKSMPFLSSKNEEKVLKRYKKCVKYLEGKPGAENECDAVERAISYLEAVAKRKESARWAFADKLKDVARQAEIAAMVFSDNGLIKTLEEEVQRSSFQAAPVGDPPPKKENPFESGVEGESREAVPTESPEETSGEKQRADSAKDVSAESSSDV